MNKGLERFLIKIQQLPLALIGRFDKYYLHPEISAPHTVAHKNLPHFFYEIANKDGYKVLEVGSREVTGKSEARERLIKATYVGFDYYPGKNVDVVGDAHKLSSYFPADEKFDVIYCSACFEHFAMPWLVATEIAKLLKVGGELIIETHFSFIAHERPWNFFQFSDMALKALFSPALGFEVIDAGLSNPIVGRFSSLADPELRNIPLKGLYCHSEYYGRKVRDVSNFQWEQVNLEEVVNATHYPTPKPHQIYA